MSASANNDLDYLAARIHARRSRMVAGDRLSDACRCRTIPELGRAVGREREMSSAKDFQRYLVNDLIQEHVFCLRQLEGPGHDVIQWMLTRFQMENVKVLLRGLLSRVSLADLQEHLVWLPREFAVDAQSLLNAATPAEFARRLPIEPLRTHFAKMEVFLSALNTAFHLEAVLDGGYFNELLRRINLLPDEEQELIEPLVRLEVEQFHFMLAVRGKFNFGDADETLWPLRVSGSGVMTKRFRAMLAAGDVFTLAEQERGHALDPFFSVPGAEEKTKPAIQAVLESLAARRFLRLANNLFRRSHIGFAAVVAYLELRRIEAANLITVSEGVRLAVAPELIRARLAQRFDREGQHV